MTVYGTIQDLEKDLNRPKRRRFTCWLRGGFRHRLVYVLTREWEPFRNRAEHTGRQCECGHRQTVFLVDGTEHQILP